ncbi:hypothetical protein ACLOJK_027958 [Asimina triloba]
MAITPRHFKKSVDKASVDLSMNQKVEKLKLICLQYATAIQWLIPSVYILEPDAIDGSFRSKPKLRSRQRLNLLNLVAGGSNIADSIL